MSGPVPFRGARSSPVAERLRQLTASYDNPEAGAMQGAVTGNDPAAPPPDAGLPDPLSGAGDAVLLFDAENSARAATAAPVPAPGVRHWRWTWKASGLITAILVAAATTGALLAFMAAGGWRPGTSATALFPGGGAPNDVGTLVINTEPPGADVSIDGVGRGVTPVTVSLVAGEHTVELRTGAATRTVPVTVQAGTSAAHYFEMSQAAGASGRLEVASDPSGATVTVDGVRRGTTPLTLSGVAAGERRVVIANGSTTITRTVRITPGATASVVASVASRGTAGGWIQIRAPFEMQVFENGDLIGTSRAERLMMPTGRHQLMIANTTYEFSTSATVDVVADRTATVQVDVPNGTMHINAIPWAEVSIDGRAYGVTPLGNVSVAVGPHDVVFRHPQFGERRRTVQVASRTPVRVGVDFNQ